MRAYGFSLILALILFAVPAQANCLKVKPPAGYQHDRFVTKLVDQSDRDNVTCRYLAYVSVFDGADDDDGDGEPDFLRIPHFVAYQMNRAPWFPKKAPKGPERPEWKTDKRLLKMGVAPSDVSYRYSRAFRSANPNWYDRGHLCMKQHAWRLGKVADKNTHTMFNAVPQRHEFNAGIWLDLENLTARWADKYESIWIIAGPVFDQGPHSPTDFIGEPNKGEFLVAVPDRLFKVVIRETDQKIETLAFIYSQFEEQRKSYDHTTHLTSIDKIEALTGLELLTSLKKDLQEQLESQTATELWED